MNYPLHRLPQASNQLPDLILDGDEEFYWPLRLSPVQVRVLHDYNLHATAYRGRLSDIEDIEEVIGELRIVHNEDGSYRTDAAGNLMEDKDMGTGEDEADDLYNKCLKIWNAWDMQR